ncbi:MAG: tetratricopeptide repeat protein [Gammaproteobacteria bacterium]|nr:MAG: tetratricopeptide repeat protein [Gammaproteobacteria bacterium]
MTIRPLFALLLICSVVPPIQAQTDDGAQSQNPPPAPAGVQAEPAVPSPAQAGNAGPGLLQRGETLLNEGKLTEAVAVLREAVAAEPQSAQAFLRLGGAQLMSQDYSGSIQSFQRAISLDASNADAFVGMGMAYLHSGRLGQARAAMIEAKRLDPAKQAKIDEVIAWIDRRVAE